MGPAGRCGGASRCRSGPRCAGVQRVLVPEPERSICTATTARAGRFVSARPARRTTRSGALASRQRIRPVARVPSGALRIGNLVAAPPDHERGPERRNGGGPGGPASCGQASPGPVGFCRGVDDQDAGGGAMPRVAGDDDVVLLRGQPAGERGRESLRHRVADEHDRAGWTLPSTAPARGTTNVVFRASNSAASVVGSAIAARRGRR